MMPWKMNMVSTVPAEERREERESALQRSAWIHCVFWGWGEGGAEGVMISVRMSLFSGAVGWLVRRCVARSCPMKPEAPVMRIVGMVTTNGWMGRYSLCRS